MISTGIAAAIFATSVVFTYFFCLRPMKRGQCAMTSCMPPSKPMSREAEIAQLRQEIQGLTEQAEAKKVYEAENIDVSTLAARIRDRAS